MAMGNLNGAYSSVDVTDTPVTAPPTHYPTTRWQKVNGLWVPSDSPLDPVQTTQGFFSKRGGGQTSSPNTQALQLAGAWVTMPRSTTPRSTNPLPPQPSRQPQLPGGPLGPITPNATPASQAAQIPGQGPEGNQQNPGQSGRGNWHRNPDGTWSSGSGNDGPTMFSTQGPSSYRGSRLTPSTGVPGAPGAFCTCGPGRSQSIAG